VELSRDPQPLLAGLASALLITGNGPVERALAADRTISPAPPSSSIQAAIPLAQARLGTTKQSLKSAERRGASAFLAREEPPLARAGCQASAHRAERNGGALGS
jgi:hypothetical protein